MPLSNDVFRKREAIKRITPIKTPKKPKIAKDTPIIKLHFYFEILIKHYK